MYVCSGIKGEIDKDTYHEATKIAFSAYTFPWKHFKNLLCDCENTRRPTVTASHWIYSGLHRAAQTAEGEEIIPAVAEKMF